MDKEYILDILLNNYNIDIEAVDLLREGGCTTYIIVEKNAKYILKVIGSAFMDTVKQSIDIMLYLNKHDFPVPKIINTVNDKPYIYVNYKNNGYILVLYEFIEGNEPDIDDKVEEIGELTGKLHLLMQTYPGNLIIRDKGFFIDRYINILKSKGYPKKELAQYIKLGDILWNTVKDLPQGYCHGDLHRGNLLLTPDNKLYILDFDTSCIAPRMFDVMVMCDTTNYFDFNPEDIDYTTSVFNQFTKGYTKYTSLSLAEKNSFYDFVALRHYQLQATIVEIYGLDCIDMEFINKQLNWLIEWRRLYVKGFTLL